MCVRLSYIATQYFDKADSTYFIREAYYTTIEAQSNCSNCEVCSMLDIVDISTTRGSRVRTDTI